MTRRKDSTDLRRERDGLRRDDDGTWRFIVDLGPGLGADGTWRPRRQVRRQGIRTKGEARRLIEDLRVGARAGTYVAPVQQTVQQYLENDWLPSKRHALAPLTWAGYERNIRNHIVPNIGGVQLQALDGVALNKLYDKLLTSGNKASAGGGLSARSVRYVHTILHGALADAVKLRRVPVNAATQATPPSAKSARAPEMRTWSSTELAAFLERCAADPSDRYGAVFTFLAMTGCRRGEALGLRWADLDLESMPAAAAIRQQALPMPRTDGKAGTETQLVSGTKGGDPRVIELDRRTVEGLHAWRKVQAEERLFVGPGYEDKGLVFARADGQPLSPGNVSKTFENRVRSKAFADLPTIRLHDLRHTWATLALEAGVDVAIVSKRLGHSSPVVTWQTYQHVRKGMQSDAAERVAAAIFG
jgi:integrase